MTSVLLWLCSRDYLEILMTDATAENLITDAMLDHVGVESDPWTCEVDKTAVRMFARSVGQVDPVYYDEEAAKSAGYRSLPAPPGYLGTPIFNPVAKDNSLGIVGGPQPSRPLTRILNGGTEIEYLGDICAGDVLSARSHISNYEERKGSIGPMLIVTSKTTYTNQNKDLVAVMTGNLIRY